MVISRVMSMVAILLTPSRVLVTMLILAHEPPSRFFGYFSVLLCSLTTLFRRKVLEECASSSCSGHSPGFKSRVHQLQVMLPMLWPEVRLACRVHGGWGRPGSTRSSKLQVRL